MLKLRSIKKNNRENRKILNMCVIIGVCILVVLFIFVVCQKEYINARIRHSDENSKIPDEINNIISTNELDVKKPKSIHAVIPIFMYHFVRDDTGDYEYPENMIQPQKLEQQLKYLKENGYETIWASDLAHLESYQKPVALTFDDGWQDFYQNGFPLFKKYQMKASFYVITNLIGTPGYCTLEELKEIKASGLIEIDSHTVTHPRLATLTKENITKELYESKQYLKEKLDITTTVMCYPYGSFNAMVKQISKEAGYKMGLAMDGGIYDTNKSKDIYAIPRIYANRSMTMDTFANYVKKSNVQVVW